MAATSWTREEVVERAKAEGLNISVRTLRYWATVGLIPAPHIVNRRACYNPDILDRLRTIDALRRRPLREIAAVLRKPGDRWYRGRYVYELQRGQEGLVLRITRRKIEDVGLGQVSKQQNKDQPL